MAALVLHMDEQLGEPRSVWTFYKPGVLHPGCTECQAHPRDSPSVAFSKVSRLLARLMAGWDFLRKLGWLSCPIPPVWEQNRPSPIREGKTHSYTAGTHTAQGLSAQSREQVLMFNRTMVTAQLAGDSPGLSHLGLSHSWSSLSFSSLVSPECGCFCTIRIPPAFTRMKTKWRGVISVEREPPEH